MRKSCLLLLLCLSLLLGIGCNQSDVEDTSAPGEDFLRMMFTTNQGERWDRLKSASSENIKTATEEYFLPFFELCTEDGVTNIAGNRYPARFDEMAEKHGCVFVPEEITISELDEEGNVDFSVTISAQRNGEVIGTAIQTGELTLQNVDGAYLVDSLWIGNLSELYSMFSE